ncbi:hypothetical protein ACVMIH_007738 [Bradyrhizobium sp. USDA 4503]
MYAALVLLAIWLLINVLLFVAMTPASKAACSNGQWKRERRWHSFRK